MSAKSGPLQEAVDVAVKQRPPLMLAVHNTGDRPLAGFPQKDAAGQAPPMFDLSVVGQNTRLVVTEQGQVHVDLSYEYPTLEKAQAGEKQFRDFLKQALDLLRGGVSAVKGKDNTVFGMDEQLLIKLATETINQTTVRLDGKRLTLSARASTRDLTTLISQFTADDAARKR